MQRIFDRNTIASAERAALRAKIEQEKVYESFTTKHFELP